MREKELVVLNSNTQSGLQLGEGERIRPERAMSSFLSSLVPGLGTHGAVQTRCACVQTSLDKSAVCTTENRRKLQWCEGRDGGGKWMLYRAKGNCNGRNYFNIQINQITLHYK